MQHEAIRRQVIEACLAAQKMGLIRGTSGNISVRLPNGGGVAITPSSIPYETLTPEMIPLLSEQGEMLDGAAAPSSETPMHLAILRARGDVNAVVHTHSKFATVLAVLKQPIPAVTVPMILYAPVPVVPFELPGSKELGDAVVHGLGQRGSAVIMESHGLVAAGASLEKAMSCAEYVGEGAEIAYWALLASGEVRGIDKVQAHKLLDMINKGRAV